MKTEIVNYSCRNQTRHTSQQGSALVVVICVASILLFAGMVMAFMTGQSVTRGRRLNQGAQALAIAEAGIADMIALLTTNYHLWRDSTNTATFGDGSFQVITRTQTNGNVLITSSGSLGGVTRITTMEILGTEQTMNDALFSLDGVILAGGDVNFSTAAFTINGNVHANGDITSASGAQNGDFTNTSVVTAGGTIGNLGAGTLQPGSPEQVLPAFDFESYRQAAISNGLYFAQGETFSGTDLLPANGIVYVNGDVIVENHSSLVGTLVVNGNITVKNNFSQTNSAPGMPALLSTRNIILQNRESYYGVIYAELNVSIQNRMHCQGGIISGGYTEIRNSVTLNQPDGYPPWADPEDNSDPQVIVGGWLR